MKVKKLLKFYFRADGLNAVLDGMILRYAMKSIEGGEVGAVADKINKVIEVKRKLGGLWRRLDNVMGRLTERDCAALKAYSDLRGGIKGLEKSAGRELHRAVVKFTRRAAGIIKGGKELFCVLDEYSCLLADGGS